MQRIDFELSSMLKRARTHRSPKLTTFALGVSVAMLNSDKLAAQEFHVYDLPFASHRIATADFNQDGAIDVALSGNWEFCVLLNNGDGTLRDPVTYDSNTSKGDIAVADFNLDQYPDIVVSGGERFAVHLNDGTGQFVAGEIVSSSDSYRAVATGDMNGDKLPDVVVVGQYDGWEGLMRWYRNMGDGTWELAHTRLTFPDKGYLVGVEVGDLDDDGDLDIAATGDGYYDGYYINDRGFNIFRNLDGLGTSWDEQIKDSFLGGDFDGPTGRPTMGDIDNDGDADLACAIMQEGWNCWIFVTHNNGHGGFGGAGSIKRIESLDISPAPDVVFTDAENDGDLDLAFVGVGSPFRLWLIRNGGNYEYSKVQLHHPFSNGTCQDIAAADITGDGAIDWLVNPGSQLAMIENVHRQQGPLFTSSPLIRGQSATLSVSDAAPGRWVYFLWSPKEPRHSTGVSVFGGLVLSLQLPIFQLATRQADADGTIEFEQPVPAQFPFDTISMQAVVRRGTDGSASQKSNFIYNGIANQ